MHSDPLYEFRISTQIIYGRNSATKIGDIAAGTGQRKFQMITDKGVSGAGVIDCLLPPLKAAGIDVVIFNDVEPNPTVQTVDKAFRQYAHENCQGIIACL